MNNIKALYTNFDDIITEFGKDKIISRFDYFIELIEEFIESLDTNAKEKIKLNDKVLKHCIMDYFSDIYRLKEFHGLIKINTIKRVAYESQWLLRRKPIQILISDVEDEKLIFANEKFVLTYLTMELLDGNENKILTEDSSKKYKAFIDSLYYHLKYRDCDAKVLELMILAFKSGLNFN